MDLPVPLVELFTLETQTEICEFHLSDLHQLGQLLLVLDAERCAAILKSLAEAAIPDIEDFVELQNYLDTQPFHSACASLHVHLLKSLTPQKFIDVLQKLQTAEKKAIFKECFLSNMSELVKNIKTLILFKSVLSAPEYESLCTQTKTTVTSNLNDLEDFILCIEILNEQEKIKFFMHQTSNLICWAQDEKKLGIILMHCPNPLFEALNAQLSGQFRQLIGNNLSFLNLLSGLSPEKQERLVNVNQEFLLETIFKNPDSHVFKDVAGLPNYYWSLKPNFIHLMTSSNKIKAFEFMHALLFEEYPSIKDKYEKLIQKPSNSRVNFFEQLSQIDAIVSEIAKLPQALTQKLLKALKISAPISTEPLVLKQKLKEYITDKLDSKPCSKKSKASIFSR